MSKSRILKKLLIFIVFFLLFTISFLFLSKNTVSAKSNAVSVVVSAQVYACELVVQLNKGEGINNLNLQTPYLLSIKNRANKIVFSLVGETDQRGNSIQDLCANNIYMFNTPVDIYIEAFNGLRKQISNIELFVYARSTLNVTIDLDDFVFLPNSSHSHSTASSENGINLELPNLGMIVNKLEEIVSFLSKLGLIASIIVGITYSSIYISRIFKSLLKEYIYAVKYIYRYITLGNIKNVYS